MRVLICGGGVIGALIAYFLSCRGVKATVIEGTGLACAASGKSGGFLACDWCDGSPLAALSQHSEARATGVTVDGRLVGCNAVVIAMGPWSILAASWLPLPVVFGLKGHSLVFDTGTKIPAEAAFIEYRERSGARFSPELFPRTDGTTYVCAISSEERCRPTLRGSSRTPARSRGWRKAD